jgi:hypothetical protein
MSLLRLRLLIHTTAQDDLGRIAEHSDLRRSHEHRTDVTTGSSAMLRGHVNAHGNPSVYIPLKTF